MVASKRVLIIDDDPEVRYTLRASLARDGLSIDEAETAAEGLERLAEPDAGYDFVLLDHRLPDGAGLDILEEIRRLQPAVLVVMMTAYGSRRTAALAVDRGAYDFFTKPIQIDELRVVMARALERRTLAREGTRLRAQAGGTTGFGNLIGKSRAMNKVFETLARIVSSDTTVLVLGESGTGKELVAEAIHFKSKRAEGPSVKLNCVAIPETLLESELFGHERGAFTGAHQRKIGKFELADGGTILLDEIGDMSLETQAKILRVLQEREFERVGGVKPVRVDVRVVAATNRNLALEVREGRFREDLYFRLNVVTVTLPPLRDRVEDIPLLTEHFIHEANEAHGKHLERISPAALDAVVGYAWPGNVRQLRHAIERAVIWSEGDELRRQDLPAEVVRGSLVAERAARTGTDDSLPITMYRIERQILIDALRSASGVQATAARRLGISERSMWHRVKKHGIDVERLKG
ncbi:MAG TPA: sigma-54 dependent transcriptional regulator [Acidobacteriota bacterium]|nr:sigma-54 dependent transcriptional regulator [Acidobacteriota bacterium]